MESPHILLVEDDDTARRLLADVLHEAGHRVTAARDGETALELLAEGSFDAVVTDIRMRNVDGVQVLHAARERDNPLPVILLTGFGSLESAIAALRAGAYDYLLKPVDPDELLKRLAKALEQRATEQRRDQAVHIIAQGLAQLQEQENTSPTPETNDLLSPSRPPSAAGREQSNQQQRYIQVGTLALDTFRHTATFDGQSFHVTPIEYELLHCLARTAGRVVGYRDIVRATHGHDTDEFEAQSLLKAHIRNLRRKIDPSYLVNVRGTGYMLLDPASSEQGKGAEG